MKTEARIISGEILALLESKGGLLTVEEIVNYLPDTKEMILVSLGWLLSEGLIDMNFNRGQYYVMPVTKRFLFN